MKLNPKVPPKHLHSRGRELWLSCTEAFDFDRVDCQTLLLAAESLDRAEQCRELIERDGAVTLDRWGQARPNPAVAMERDARRIALLALRQLRLDEIPAGKLGRPSGGKGV